MFTNVSLLKPEEKSNSSFPELGGTYKGFFVLWPDVFPSLLSRKGIIVIMYTKPVWFYNQSGVVPVLEGRVVLVTARKSKRWIIPKGIVEKDMSPEDSAAKEAYEEAGVIGAVGKKELGCYSYPKWGGICTVRVYPLYVEKLLDEWEEMHIRRRRVVSVREAVEMVDHDELAGIILAFFAGLKKKKL